MLQLFGHSSIPMHYNLLCPRLACLTLSFIWKKVAKLLLVKRLELNPSCYMPQTSTQSNTFHSMGGARPEMFHKRFDCVEFLEEDPETSMLISTIQQALCILSAH